MFGSSTQGNNFAAAAGGAQQQQRRITPIRALTIKQLLQAQSVGDGAMVVDGREVTQATVVGRVVGYESLNMLGGGAITAKHFGYRITDNTGMIVARQWIEPDSNQEPLPINSHVRASGTVKIWQDAPVVTGNVVAVVDSNELNYHLLDAVLTHLRLTQGNRRPQEQGSKASVTNTAAAVGVKNMLPGGDTKILLTDLLVNLIRQNAHGGDSGMSMDELTAAAQRYNFGSSDVFAAMRTLAAEGTVYQMHDNRFAI
ncbi:replication factor A2 [Strigomonas culicis]|uniref:Replication factor A2 n=1 Tax=Strigomonas culicis TaxID=28005 RepID=S9UMP8_9TRYP|nr:replication factor A2 [Strigomonas culicis]|eukprot:EPY32092.1 replication factor A2 [Strigomonas culicis]